MKYEKNMIGLFILIVFLQLISDPYLHKCKDKNGVLLISIHHMIQWYFFIGSIVFGYHKIHLIIVILAFVIHKSYGMCPITIVHNKLCKFDNKTYLYTFINRFIETFNIHKFKAVQIYYFMLLCVFIYDILHIYKDLNIY